MYDLINKSLQGVLVSCLVAISFFLVFINRSAAIPVLATVVVMIIITMILCYMAYHDGTGRPRQTDRMMLEKPYMIVFRIKSVACDIVGLKACEVFDNGKIIIPGSGIIIYYSRRFPGHLNSEKPKSPEFVILTGKDDCRPRICEWEIPKGFTVHQG